VKVISTIQDPGAVLGKFQGSAHPSVTELFIGVRDIVVEFTSGLHTGSTYLFLEDAVGTVPTV
jgi:hypothetical protein